MKNNMNNIIVIDLVHDDFKEAKKKAVKILIKLNAYRRRGMNMKSMIDKQGEAN